MKTLTSYLRKKSRAGIAMLELIFAIVIMAIVLMSAPLINTVANQSTFTGLQQESIMAAATQMSTIMIQEWDHNDANITLESPVLQTNSIAIPACTTPQPRGVTDTNGRFCQNTANLYTSASNIAQDSNFLDIDDFHSTSATVLLYNNETYATQQGDYLDQNISILTSVEYGIDTVILGSNVIFNDPFNAINGNTSNIKLISVELRSSNSAEEIKAKQIRLSAFMCNIGEPKTIRTN